MADADPTIGIVLKLILPGLGKKPENDLVEFNWIFNRWNMPTIIYYLEFTFWNFLILSMKISEWHHFIPHTMNVGEIILDILRLNGGPSPIDSK